MPDVWLLVGWSTAFLGGGMFCLGLTMAITRRAPLNPIWGRPWSGDEARVLGAIYAGYGPVFAVHGLLSYLQGSLGYDAARSDLQLGLTACVVALSVALLVVALRHELHSGEPPSQGPTQAAS